MGPRAAGLTAAGALHAPPRWQLRLERDWGVPLHRTRPGRDARRERLVALLEAGLRQIDFPEVTPEDRIAYLEQALRWQVRRALLAGRFDLALEIRSLGAPGLAELMERRPGAIYSFTSSAAVSRRSIFSRSGDHPGTTEPGAPWFPPGGVTPPGPEK
jgi:hypothetical protein